MIISSSDSLKFLVSGSQLLEFIQLSTKILAQFVLEKDKRWKFKLLYNSLISALSSSSLESVAGQNLVSSVLGCLVNISSCKDLLVVSIGNYNQPPLQYLPC